jgi:MFS family permease
MKYDFPDYFMLKFETLYYLFQIFSSLFLWLPVFYEYQKYLGLTHSQIFTLQSVYYVAFCLFEIPSGLIADAFGRLRCLRVGSVALVISHIFIIACPTYFGFGSHFVVLALGRSLINAAASAYLYDRLGALGQSERYNSVEGRARAIGLIARVLCWPAVGYLMEWYRPLPYWLTGLIVSGAFFVAMALPAEKIRSPGLGADSVKGIVFTLKPVFRLLKDTPVWEELFYRESPFLLWLESFKSTCFNRYY